MAANPARTRLGGTGLAGPLGVCDWSLTHHYMLAAVAEGKNPGAASSMLKVLATELSQALTELAMEAAGPRGRIYQPHATCPGGPVSEFEPPDGYVSGDPWQAVAPLRYFNDRAMTTALLEKIVAGTAIVALAASEAVSGERWQDVSTVAERDGDQWVLGGSKIVAVSAPLATHLLITARTPSGISLFLVDVGSDTTGIEMHHYRTVDDRRASDLVIDGLRLPGCALLGEEGEAWASLAQARDEGAAAVCAEAVGCMRKVLADTVEYCKQRQQFGQPIGSFQVLQHRIVDMYMELEQAVAAVYLAVLNLETEPAMRARAVSAAKATVGRAARFIGQQAVQLHGGMGMTEELAIGHYFKRLTALQYEFGSTDYHVARYAEPTR